MATNRSGTSTRRSTAEVVRRTHAKACSPTYRTARVAAYSTSAARWGWSTQAAGLIC